VNVGQPQRGVVRPGIGQELGDQSLQSRKLFSPNQSELRFGSPGRQPRRNNLQRPFDARERIADLMRQPGSNLAERRQAVGTPQLRLRIVQLAIGALE